MTNRRFRALTLPIFALLCARRTVEAGFLVVKAQWLVFSLCEATPKVRDLQDAPR
jgi:hypothetical protein